MAPASTTTARGYVVTADMVAWLVPVEDSNPKQWNHKRAWKGETIPAADLPAAEIDRLLAADGIAPVDSPAEAAEVLAEADDAAEGLVPPGEDGDAELAALSAADLIAYVVQHPEERERVLGIEQARGSKARKTVMEAADLGTNVRQPASLAGSNIPPGLVDAEY